MSRLIDDLMDVSRISQGKIELHRQRIAMAEVLNDAIEATRPVIEEFGHTLHVELPAVELALHADATRLSQAFTNLIHNAVKYMDKGGRIEINVRREGQEVIVVFRDTGIGITADRLDSIFEMFSQEETALSRSRGGLGIGLSLTRRLLQLHGGSVRARSDGRGRGSEFVVRLPLVGTEANHETAGLVMAPSVAPTGSLRILVADDNRDCVETLTALLEAMGHRVRCAFDGAEAVLAAADFDPEVVLLDVGMPGLNGYEACREIRKLANASNVRICAVTGWGQPDDVREASDSGFDGHFVKPVDPETLLTWLSQS